ncbi:MAG: LamG domain-containing protein [Labilithrix sp.]
MLAVLPVACSLLVDTSGLAGDGEGDGGSRIDSSSFDGGAVTGDAAMGDGGALDGAPDPLADGLVGYWKFDETGGTVVHDSSGNGNDGAMMPGATRAPGKVGGAVSFDGVRGYVEVPKSASLVTTKVMTVTLWANLQLVTEDPRLVGRRDSWDTKINGNKPQLSLVDGEYAISDVPIIAGAWHHLAFVFQDGKITIYVDGSPTPLGTDQTKASGELPSDPGELIMGAYPSSPESSFATGLLDEVRVYRRVLTADEVKTLAR